MSRSTKTKEVFSKEEKEVMVETARDKQAEAKGQNGESLLFAKIAEMKGPDKEMAERIHRIVMEVAPELSPKTWYGMPAYANKEGKPVCFFQSAGKFKVRYATFGFSEFAKLDEGNMWSTSFALKKLTSTEEKKIAELVKKAVG